MYAGSEWQALMRSNMEDGRLIVVSNREPFTHEHAGGEIKCTQPAGGLTAALHPLLSSWRGTWIAHGSGAADREVVDRRSRIMVPPERPAYTLRRVWLPERQQREYYSGLANRGLWPLCHNVYQRPRFCAGEWESYREVNAIFARAVLEEAGDEPCVVFVQDYHLALVPRMLRNRHRGLKIVQFWHIPWPSAETFAAFPWKEELLDGMLGNDLVGFHLNRHCANFLASVDEASEALVDREGARIVGENNVTVVRDFPIGLDFEAHCETARSAKTCAAIEQWRRQIGPGVRVGIGIDRIDYTKGIPERLRGLDLFLERNSEWREKLVFIQVGAPSRTEIPEYRLLANEIDREVARVNRRWRTARWQPIHFLRHSLPPEETIALHRIADFCLVTALHDGMNLVAKEFIASRSDLDGALILSQFAGASNELASAVTVNPFSEDEIAEAISTALHLSPVERRQRMARMRAAVQKNDVYRWAADIMSTLAHVERWGGRAAALRAGQGAAAGLARVSWG